jgi:RNA polymerase sigma-70 factor (ECF subfamily)
LDAIERLYRARFPDFLRVASMIAGTVDGGRDAVHDAFVSALRGRASFRGESTLEAWLWRAVVNSARKHRRRREPVPLGALPEPREASWNGGLRSDDDDELRVAIVRLPERQRLVLFLR